MQVRNSTALNVVLVVVCLLLAGFLLLFGISHLIHPGVSYANSTQNTLVSLAVSVLGLLAMGVALRIVRRMRRERTRDAA
jgi:membrane protein implicated in regulation of membrane protease activity